MHSFRKPAVMIIIIVCMLFSVIEAFAASGESIEVCIPVANHGHTGMVGLFDGTGENLLGTMQLESGESGDIKIIRNTLGKKTYIIRMLDEDTEDVTYDDSVYEADVYVGYDAKDELDSAVIVKRRGEENKVSDGVVFAHTDGKGYGNHESKPEEEKPDEQKPGPGDDKPTVSPDPGTDQTKEQPKLPQTGTLRWLVPYLLVSGFTLIIAGVICLRAGRYEE